MFSSSGTFRPSCFPRLALFGHFHTCPMQHIRSFMRALLGPFTLIHTRQLLLSRTIPLHEMRYCVSHVPRRCSSFEPSDHFGSPPISFFSLYQTGFHSAFIFFILLALFGHFSFFHALALFGHFNSISFRNSIPQKMSTSCKHENQLLMCVVLELEQILVYIFSFYIHTRICAFDLRACFLRISWLFSAIIYQLINLISFAWLFSAISLILIGPGS